MKIMTTGNPVIQFDIIYNNNFDHTLEEKHFVLFITRLQKYKCVLNYYNKVIADVKKMNKYYLQ